jgi:cell division protein ZipA
LVAELRWILLGLSALLLVGIWWWGARRSRQAPGDAQLRETSAAHPGSFEHEPLFEKPTPAPDGSDDVGAAHEPAPASAYRAKDSDSREWGVPPFEPLSIRTADFEEVQTLDMAMSATPVPDTSDVSLNLNAADGDVMGVPPVRVAAPEAPFEAAPLVTDVKPEVLAKGAPLAASTASRAELPHGPAEGPSIACHAPPAAPTPAPVPASTARDSAPFVAVAAPSAPASAATPRDPTTTAAAAPAQGPNVSETQRIVTVRVCAAGDSRWAGTELMVALEAHGLAHGRYKVFHRKHSDGRTLFCAASLVEPGTFDIATMPADEFRGLSLFAVLPGPAEPLQTIDALIATAADLAETLHGDVQDSKGVPLTAQRAEALREDVARFQASLTMN